MDYKTALSKAMALCSKKEYCKSEIRQKLQKWNLENDDINKVIDKLSDDNFLSEERYAQAFVKDKFRFNKWGKLKIKSHLRQKQIDDSIISEAIKLIDNDEYIEMIKSLITAKERTVKAKNDYDKKQKLLRFLAQKGFEPSLVSEQI